MVTCDNPNSTETRHSLFEGQNCNRRGASPDGCGFTVTENPYLFPLHLLDVATGRGACDGLTLNDDGEPPSDGDKPGWWLLHAKPRQEKKLADELRSLNVPHYLPVTKCKAVSRGRTRLTRAPQFPGYLFLNGTDNQRLLSLKTNRVVATHCIDKPSEVARQLWDLADLIEKGVPLRTEERLAAGQTVRVRSGLLKDKQGVIIKRGGKTRLFIFVSGLLGGVSLEIEQHLVEPY